MSWKDNLEAGTPAYLFASSDGIILRAVAGPGTGKSFALRRKIARLIEQGTIPDRILAVTFTRTAASDLRCEINSLKVNGVDQVLARTLHSLCYGILINRKILGLSGLVPRALLEHEKKPMLYDIKNKGFGSIHDIEKKILAFEAAWARLQHEEPGYSLSESDQTFERELSNWLRYHESMLIGEVIPETLKYLRDNPLSPDVSKFDHVLVDEYQDFNKAEQELISILRGNGTLTVIGDDDQSIYSFKYANPEGIREFEKIYPGCESIKFIECRRCPKTVVNMASNLIANNTNRTLGPLLPFSYNDDGNVIILQWQTLDEEVVGIADIVARHLESDPIEPKDILILTPRRKIGYRIRNTLLQRGISAKSYFSENALDSDISRKSYSLLNILAIPDDKVALRFLLGQGNKEYRSNAYKKIQERAEADGCTVKNVLDRIISREIKIPHTNNIVEVYKNIQKEIENLWSIVQEDPKQIINYIAPRDNEELSDFRNALETAYQVVDESFVDGEELHIWLEKLYTETRDNISMPNVPDEVDHVRIMSLHSSKGLSSKFVVITSCIDDFLPGEPKPDMNYKLHEEEQRRLLYVAITRCKNEVGNYPGKLFLSSWINISGQDALQMGIDARAGRRKTVRTSRFFSQFGPNIPQSIIGSKYLKSLEEP